jgi:hypothetical protein
MLRPQKTSRNARKTYGERIGFRSCAKNSSESVTYNFSRAKYRQKAVSRWKESANAPLTKETYFMHLGYWLQFWWMFPVALAICITV